MQVDDRDVFLVGTAHISKESVEDVKTTVRAVKPDTVCIELCQGRYDSLTKKDAWKKMNIFKILKEKKAMLLMAQLILSTFYRKLGEKLEVTPGAEMLEGATQAKEVNAELVMADRRIDITLKRVWGYLGFWSKMKLITAVMLGGFTEEIDEELIDEMKQKDQLENVLGEFAEKFPEIKRRLIDERDIYLAQKIRQAPGKTIVAVVGAGHTPGIAEHIQQDEPLDELETTPEPSTWPKILKWSIPLAIIGFVIYSFFKNGASHSVENIYIWILVNGILSALGAALALAHPLTVVSAFIAAPITSLNPAIAAGWFAGIVQAWIKTPTVQDFENLPEATGTFKGWWTNPVLKVLVVTALANFGSAIGTWVAIPWIISRSV